MTALTMAPCMPSATWWVKVTGHLGEADLGQALLVLVFGQGAGDASDVAAPCLSLGRGELVLGHHVADADPPARSQDPEHLGQDRHLVDREVDHAVGE